MPSTEGWGFAMGQLNQSWPDLFEKAASLCPRLAGLRGKRGIALKFHRVDLGNSSNLRPLNAEESL
jgi:hypothetical protein